MHVSGQSYTGNWISQLLFAIAPSRKRLTVELWAHAGAEKQLRPVLLPCPTCSVVSGAAVAPVRPHLASGWACTVLAARGTAM